MAVVVVQLLLIKTTRTTTTTTTTIDEVVLQQQTPYIIQTIEVKSTVQHKESCHSLRMNSSEDTVQHRQTNAYGKTRVTATIGIEYAHVSREASSGTQSSSQPLQAATSFQVD